ncbi:MAG TPA: copper chaperone PCu(A)C [Caulobacteraceae bacterium]|nr:copper chaperone PCu(A)C [Caulobacteraceae bacterium]
MTPSTSIAAAAVAAALIVAPHAACSRDYGAGTLHIGDPWIRATPNAAPTAAGYLTVTNRGKSADRLLGGSSPLAQAIEPHTMSMTGEVMRMRLTPGGFPIPPGATLTLAPGGNHLMLIGPRRPFKPGDHVPATLRFARVGQVTVVFAVR